MAWIEHEHASPVALAEALAGVLHHACSKAIEVRGQVRLALAGGSTPLPAYGALAAMPLDWDRTFIMPTDERCVPHDHAASNVGALRAAFARSPSERIAPLTVPDGDCPRSESYARALMERESARFDVVLLGMGNDAHTASLFPGAPQLDAAMDAGSGLDACRIDPDPLPAEAPFARITLTAARLLRARNLHLVITGEGKHAVLRQSQASRDMLRHPIAALLHAPDTIVHVHWSP